MERSRVERFSLEAGPRWRISSHLLVPVALETRFGLSWTAGGRSEREYPRYRPASPLTLLAAAPPENVPLPSKQPGPTERSAGAGPPSLCRAQLRGNAAASG